jgi:hypothetical protein
MFCVNRDSPLPHGQPVRYGKASYQHTSAYVGREIESGREEWEVERGRERVREREGQKECMYYLVKLVQLLA